MPSQKMPSLFICHGGGPWPWMPEMQNSYRALKGSLEHEWTRLSQKPLAIVMISAHWEASNVLISSGERPGMIYDYGGFPSDTYSVRYAAPGNSELAARIHRLLTNADIPSKLDPARGFDHGTFVPLYIMNPSADVPVVQVSLQQDLDPSLHFRIGEALSSLRSEGVLIIGSGLSFHNLRFFDRSGMSISKAFDQWLYEALSSKSHDQRIAQVLQWEKAPSARAAHPREEHLIPLIVALGAAPTSRSTRCFHQNDFFGGLSISNYRFED